MEESLLRKIKDCNLSAGQHTSYEDEWKQVSDCEVDIGGEISEKKISINDARLNESIF